MKKALILILLSIIFGNIMCAEENDDKVLNAVVKINAVYSKANFTRPWLNHPQFHGSGSGVVIRGNRILTTAHNIADATYITVEKRNDANSVSAKVEMVDHQCDLAILSVSDKDFFEDIVAFEIGDTPPTKTEVLAVGYPIGGSGLSITKGIISRIEITTYNHSMANSFLAAQVDAALNPGNSGGPIIFSGKIVGIAFQGCGNGIGYMIHSEIIKHFLKDSEDGIIDGFGDLQASLLSLENPDTRRFFKMKDDQSGVLVYNVTRIPGMERQLQDNDIILAINDKKLMNNGNLNSNTLFTTEIHSKQMGEHIKLKILRNAQEKEISITPIKYSGKILPMIYNTRPSMYMIGGLVFTPLSYNYLNELSVEDQLPPNLIEEIGKEKIRSDEQVIVLSEILGDEVNLSYQGFAYSILEEINNKRIYNIKELAETIDNLKDEFVVFKFKDKSSIILSLNKMKSAQSRIMHNYGLQSDRSNDLMKK